MHTFCRVCGTVGDQVRWMNIYLGHAIFAHIMRRQLTTSSTDDHWPVRMNARLRFGHGINGGRTAADRRLQHGWRTTVGYWRRHFSGSEFCFTKEIKILFNFIDFIRILNNLQQIQYISHNYFTCCFHKCTRRPCEIV